MAKKLALTEAQIKEMLASYNTKQANAVELSEMYGISSSTFYRLLHLEGGELQNPINSWSKPTNGKVKIRKLPKSEFDATPEEAAVEAPVVHTSQMAVVVDKEQLVQSAHPVRRVGLKTWEVSYTGSIMVEAEEIEEAIKEARKLGMVKRIYSVKLK